MIGSACCSSCAGASTTGVSVSARWRRFAAEDAYEDSADLVFLPDASAGDWATIFSHSEVREVSAGLAVMQAGEEDRGLYLLTEGTLGVRLPRDETIFKSIDAPAVVGEL